jgi:Family of unknown function (DUF6328)
VGDESDRDKSRRDDAARDGSDRDDSDGDESGKDGREDVDPHDGRDETRNERLDRNWNELLQELRVTQTGVQILTGFLLTLPFQQRFQQLSEFQHGLYLVTFVLAATTTGLFIAPVGFHRAVFRQHEKEALVRWSDRFARAGMTMLALAVSAVALLVFDVVAGRWAGIVASVTALVMFATLWMIIPKMVSSNEG